MKIPHLGLFSRLLILFAVTTIIISICIALGSFAITEQRAKIFISERQTQLYEMLQQIAENPLDKEKLTADARNNRVSIMVKRGTQLYSTADNFPEFSALTAAAQPIGNLFFSKVGAKYFLYASFDDTSVVVTSKIANLIVYPEWLILWPWIVAILVLMASYYVLKRLLNPISQAIESAKRISEGDLAYRITAHPKTELARLTTSLNKMAADLQKLFQSKNEMLMAISHELRTPLGRMKVSLALLQQNEITADLTSDINYMNDLIGQLLEGERLQQGSRVLNIATYYLPTLVDDVLSETRLSERVEITSALPEVALRVDVGRIKFVLRNLVQNAIDHATSEEKVKLSVTITEHSLLMSVTDHGPGIPTDMLEKVFTPFFHAEDINHRSTDGVGLALFLCKRIAEAHDGQLTVTNTAPHGCQFCFSLPISCIAAFE